MFRIDQHIQLLLLDHDCVVIPGLGGFVAHRMPAQTADDGTIMLPPTRTVGFNQSLTVNDSLLIQSYVDAYDMSYPEAQTVLEKEVEEMRHALSEGGSFVVNSVGTLSLQADGAISFQPLESGILTPSLYGLSDINLVTGSSFRTKDTNVISIFETTSENNTQTSGYETDNIISIRTSTLKKIAVAVVIIVLAIAYPLTYTDTASSMLSSFGFFNNNKVENVQELFSEGSSRGAVKSSKVQAAKQSASKSIRTLPEGSPKAERTSAISRKSPLATANSPKPAPSTYFTIVLAAKVSLKNANNYVDQLHKQGFTDARTIDDGKSHKVIFGSYSTEEEARKVRNAIFCGEDFSGAWIQKQGV